MNRRWNIASLIALGVVFIVVLGLVPVYILQKAPTSTSNTVANLLYASLNAPSIYPDGTYAAKISEFTYSTNTNHLFLPLNETLLNEISQIDNTSFIFEAGREQFLYFRIPEEVVTPSLKKNPNIRGIGIYFGQKTGTLNVVPINSERKISSGVNIIPTNLPDRSKLIRIKITTASTMCSQTGILDSCTKVIYSAYLVFDNGQLSASLVTYFANVACGNICGYPRSYSACSASCGSKCDGNQVAGADTPVSRRYTLNRKYAEFQFQYETYHIKDQIKVWNGDKLSFDSGCVGTSGVRNVYLTLSKQVNIRVDVEPNCDCQSITGCTGTAWHFTVMCPELCSPEQYKTDGENNIKLQSKGRDISNGMILYINENAEMPSLIASSCEPVSWEISFNYQATFDNAWAFKETLNGYTSESESFDIVRALQNKTLGGNVTAKWTVTTTKDSGDITFKIIGTQPSKTAIMAYINDHSSVWFAKKVAAHESHGGQQFLSNGYPLYSQAGDNGYGIYQLTNPKPTYNEVWNWKANIHRGLLIINEKINEATRWMNSQRKEANQNTGQDQPVDDERVGHNCFFSDNSNITIADAVAIKIFNGAQGGHYCAWDNKNLKWKFNRVNSRNENYVELVCNQNV